MRQISIILATAIITATVAVAGVLAVNPNPARPGAGVRAPSPVDATKLMKCEGKLMKDAKEVPEHNCQAF